VRYGFGTFVAVGPSGIYTSTDGSNWIKRPARTRQKLNAVDFANDSFYVVGYGGTILQSGFVASSPANVVRQPQNLTVISGRPASFSVDVDGRLPMNFQWFRNNVPIPGATESSLELPAALPGDAANYHVVARNEFGSQASAAATLTVVPINVSVVPEALYAFTGGTAAFTAGITGAAPIGYQWDINGQALAGATNASLAFTNAQQSNTLGYYFVTAKFPYGEVRSTEAQFVVVDSVDQVYLSSDPQYLQLPVGDSTSVTGLVYGPTPSSIQWFNGANPVAGATNALLTLNNLQVTNSGDYGFVVSYPGGSVTNVSALTLLVYYAEPAVLVSLVPSGGNSFGLNFTGLPGRSYQVDYATNLANPTEWQYFDSIYLNSNPGYYLVNPAVFGLTNRAFFRLQSRPP
jgi:hypothetical protein